MQLLYYAQEESNLNDRREGIEGEENIGEYLAKFFSSII
jgi:hypothetical protein